MEYYGTLESPLGIIEIIGTDTGISTVQFPKEPTGLTMKSHRFVDLCSQQLMAYFDKTLQEFDIPLDLKGTAFQLKVWEELKRIPYGKSVSYQFIAKKIGMPKGSQAVGNANGKNPIAIIIPCHRVVGSDGSLTGYAGGLERKKHLLELEKPFRQLGLFD